MRFKISEIPIQSLVNKFNEENKPTSSIKAVIKVGLDDYFRMRVDVQLGNQRAQYESVGTFAIDDLWRVYAFTPSDFVAIGKVSPLLSWLISTYGAKLSDADLTTPYDKIS